MTEQQQAALDVNVVELTPQPTAAVRIARPMTQVDLAELFDTHLPTIAERIADLGGQAAGPPYGRYHEWGEERVDVEIGIPVAAPIANLRPLSECEEGEIGASELPAGNVAVTVHRGSYDGLSATYDKLGAWIREQGHEAGQGPWESYVDDPAEVDDPASLRTEVVWPLA
jgi:effector-binding domain-containing protein